jgi:hypothetical protein
LWPNPNSNSHADCKPVSDGHSNGYSDSAGIANTYSYSYNYGHPYRNAFGDADLHARRNARAMEHRFTLSDSRCALRLCADCHALLCVRRSVQRDAFA